MAILVASDMATAAQAWSATLDDGQRSAALWPSPTSGDRRADNRLLWYYTPTDHGGLTLGAQSPEQQRLGMQLVASGLSEAAYVTVCTVMGLENVLDRLERFSRDWGFDRGRDPGRYWLRVYGEPGSAGVWGWRFGGHHVSLNFLVVSGRLVSTTPCFIGADPASAPLLGDVVLRPLGSTEDLARALVTSLADQQLAMAVIRDRAPSDIISGNRPYVSPGDEMIHMNDSRLWHRSLELPRLRELAETIDQAAEAASGYDAGDHLALAFRPHPAGIGGIDLDQRQRSMLQQLVAAYEGRAPEVLQTSSTELRIDQLHFAWAGGIVAGEPHYYRIEGPDLLIEYDNTQRSVNHVHSVWRRPSNDFGRDVLRAHLAGWPHQS